MTSAEIQTALARLDHITRRLRRECPWDREQDERSIVPHTVEEAYELADAAHAGDDAKLRDELGDVLFQVHFLALLLEERGAGSLAEVADHTAQKLIRRHPHVFGAGQASTAEEVLRSWDAIKQSEPDRDVSLFGEVPENLPGLLHARKLQRRAASSGFDFPGVEGPLSSLRDELDELEAALDVPASADPLPAAADQRPGTQSGEDRQRAERAQSTGSAPERPTAGESAHPEAFHELGDVLFAAVNLARKLKLDPELALRAASTRFTERVQAAADQAERAGETWSQCSPDRQLHHYASARLATRERAGRKPPQRP